MGVLVVGLSVVLILACRSWVPSGSPRIMARIHTGLCGIALGILVWNLLSVIVALLMAAWNVRRTPWAFSLSASSLFSSWP